MMDVKIYSKKKFWNLKKEEKERKNSYGHLVKIFSHLYGKGNKIVFELYSRRNEVLY